MIEPRKAPFVDFDGNDIFEGDVIRHPSGDRGLVIAALFVQNDGCYQGLDSVDPWGIDRDARLYNGPYPVVAHPPCQKYGKLAKVNFIRWGGEHNRPLNDKGCFAAALAAVNCWGGVLEHPAYSKAWPLYNLAKPSIDGGWSKSGEGWVCEVWQSAYGHKADKRTWLYYKGYNDPFELNWEKHRGSHQIGFYDQRGKDANRPTLSKREANATPIAFRDELIKLAASANTQ